MGAQMSQILPNLYVGGLQNASDLDQLRKNSITHIVSVYENPKPLNKICEFLCISARDDERENLSKHFSRVNDFVHEGRLNGSVLIHCAVGVSRSVTLAIAYIMTVTNLPFEQVLKVVQHSRTIANPNDGFKKQLKKFGKPENLDREIHRFRQKFDIENDRFDDLEECKRILAEEEARGRRA